jgi:mRNA interferase MazF
MRRGEVRLVEFGPAHGSEAAKRRPAVIVSNDAANATASRLGMGVVTVVPITSNVRRVLDFQVHLSAGEAGLDRESKAQAEQVRAVAVERVGRLLGPLGALAMRELDDALRLHLAL